MNTLRFPDFSCLVNDAIERAKKDEKFKSIFDDCIETSPIFSIHTFPQIWGNTTLGFGGVGGDAMTTAYTTVLEDIVTGVVFVYFDITYAYTIYKPNSRFFNALHNKKLASVIESGRYENFI